MAAARRVVGFAGSVFVSQSWPDRYARVRWNRKLTAVLLLVGVAVAGYMLRSFVPSVLAEYEQANSFSPAWGYVYLAVVGLSVAAFLTLIVWAVWTLAANTRDKDRRRIEAGRAPSQMSRRQQQEELEAQLAESRILADDGTLSIEVREPIRRSLDAIEDKRQR